MMIVHSIKELKTRLSGEREKGNSIGLVPTMGALHDGHLSLVRQCKSENDVCVVSIFVNPTQFNDKNDFNTYPRTFEEDCRQLEQYKCDYVFAPSEKEIYPEPDTRVFDFGSVGKVMEGARRPGHFNGVAQIVSKLLDIMLPGKAYFGEKDFQQVVIIRKMVEMLNMPVEIVNCPIVREKDGLAMSSRNTRLTDEEQQIAPVIARTLKESRNFTATKSVKEVKEWVLETLNAVPRLSVEYYEIVDSKTLQPVKEWQDSNELVGCIAVYCGKVRLIDNIKYEEK